MMAIEPQRMGDHPYRGIDESSGAINRQNSADSIDKELDWLIEAEQHKMKSNKRSSVDELDKLTRELRENEKDNDRMESPEYRNDSPVLNTNNNANTLQNTTENQTEGDNDNRQRRSPPHSPPQSPTSNGKPVILHQSQESPSQDASNDQSRSYSDEEDDWHDSPELSPRQLHDDIDDDDYNLTSDQKMAMLELQKMKLNLTFPDEDPPDYDVTERVRQLNAELANDPTPIDDDRERSIKFQEDPVSLIVPPADYTDDEDNYDEEPLTPPGDDDRNDIHDDEDDDDDMRHIETVDNVNLGRMNLEEDVDGQYEEEVAHSESMNNNGQGDSQPDDRAEEHSENSIQQNNGSGDAGNADLDNKSSEAKNDNSEKVLVERDGKFRLVSVKDLEAEDGGFGLAMPADSDSERAQSGRSDNSLSSSGSYVPTPPREPRPATASASMRSRRINSAAPQRRVQSATPKKSEALDNWSYESPYALTPEEKKQLKEQQKQKEKRKKREEEERKKKKVPTATLR